MVLADRHSLPHLPPEVVDVILDHVATHPRTLRSCSVVARAWLPRSRHHLFRRLSISTSRLYRFLARCELFGPAVVSLVFRASKSRRRHHVITALLCEKARRGLFLSYTSLTSLQLTGLHFPALDQLYQLIAAFPRLENIYLLDITWNNATQSTPAPNHSAGLSRLRHFSLSARDLDLVLAWLDGQDLPVLDSFSLTLSDGSATGRIIPFFSKHTLRRVQIGPHGSESCKQLVQRI
ncbi:hypothetical protein B0H16DRAFT_1854647 [Mycena metata]|uniref:F-box domain-containing protein n=1 Tax=Mycena metata TaxID=1033252 RepID=A0AAD7IM16_9AGAR|nr:hypothetical protein B0H16DRAFT_1854647 [Mycena metata]